MEAKLFQLANALIAEDFSAHSVQRTEYDAYE
jgi:hypothetical protein